ncbi:hypothetical protein [Helicobacter bilis]|uniref:Uncharacterized protein n=1 Tax=Helicobacter bilis TaxID=37372 RepID=A0A099V3D2_9HELI|nr:hypothetical protein [Helicobacter bilis]TLE08567.1 hypothetical protein LS79_009660 [Helicobacter bilis]
MFVFVMPSKEPKAKKQRRMRKQNRQTGKVSRQRNKTKLFKIDGGLLMFLPFFIAGVTYMRNDCYKKGQIIEMLPQDESYQKLQKRI